MKSSKRSFKAVKRLVVALPLAMFASVLLLLSAPALPMRLVLLEGDQIREALLAKKNVTEDDLNALAKSRMHSLQWNGSSVSATADLSTVALERAQRNSRDQSRVSAELLHASGWQKMSLGRGPSSGYGWAHLAYVELAKGEHAEAAKALSRSFEVDMYEPRLALMRVEMAAALYEHIDEYTRSSLNEVIRIAWKYEKYALARAARERNFVSMVEQAINDDVKALEEFRTLTAVPPKN